MSKEFKTSQGIVAPYVNLSASTSVKAPLNIPHGSAPSTLSNGDLWTTTQGLYGRINGETKQLATITGQEVQKSYVDSSDFLNLYPKAGYTLGDNEIPVYSDFKFGQGAWGTLAFSFIDSQANHVVYFQATTPLRKFNIFKAYRISNSSNFIYSNEPISVTGLNSGEYVRAMFNLGTKFVVLQLASSTAPYTQTRVVIVKTNGSSKWQNWTIAYDVTSLATGIYNFALVQDGTTDRILRVTYAGGNTMTLDVFDPSLTLLRSQVLYDRVTHLDYTDRTGQNRTGAFISFGYNPYGIAFPFTWNPITESFHQKNSGYYAQTLSNGSVQGVGYALSISWDIPKTWILNGTGTPQNLIPIKSSTFRYRAYSDSTWDTEDGGIGTGYGAAGTATSIVTDEYSGELHLMVHGTWTSTSAGTHYRLNSGEYKTFSGNLASATNNTVEVSIPDGSPWSKGLNPSRLIAIGNQISFIGNSNLLGNRDIYTTFDIDTFATVARTNDTLILDSANAITDVTATLPSIIQSNQSPGNFTTVVTSGGVPTYCWIVPGQPVYTAIASGASRIWTQTSVTAPVVPSTIILYNNIVFQNCMTWNGDTGNPIFWALVKENGTQYHMAKCQGGSWAIAAPNIMATEVAAGNTNRGDTSYAASTGVSATMLTGQGRFMFHFQVPYVGGTTFYLSTYNTSNNTNTVDSWNKFNSKTAGTTDTDYSSASGYGGLTVGYNSYFGYFAAGTTSSYDAIYIVSSKDIRTGASITEDVWYTTPASRHEVFITVQSSTGLSASVLSFPLHIGGYLTTVPNTSLTLLPNKTNYVYVTKLETDRDDVIVTTDDDLLPSSFNRIRIADITTDASNIISSTTYAFAGNGLPEQAGNTGKFLTTDGKYSYWANVDAFPSQTGNANKLLTTNGTTVSWTNNYYNKSEIEIEISKSVPAGNPGMVPFIKTDSTRFTELDYIVKVGQFVDSDGEFFYAQQNYISNQDIFDSWYRFSHLPNTEDQPAVPAEVTNTSWQYNSAIDTISCLINSSSYIGFISPSKIDEYVHEVRLVSASSDDDAVGVVIAWYVDPSTGREFTLSAVRSAGGIGDGRWGIYYNYRRSDFYVVKQFTFGTSYANSTGGGGWAANASVGTKIKITRTGDTITCETTDFGSETYDDSVKYTFSLLDDVRLNKFRGPKQYGYSCYSQTQTTFKVIQMNDPANVIYNLKTNQVYEYQNNTWTLQTGQTVLGNIGPGRLVYNTYTDKLFFLNEDSSFTNITLVPDQLNNSGKILSTDGEGLAWIDLLSGIPPQTGNDGKLLSTDGTALSWIDPPSSIPTQTNNNGKFLTTNGTTLSWGTVTIPTQLVGVDNTYANALLISGPSRTDDATGDTWIFADSKGSNSNKYGIKHNQASNYIEFWGADSAKVFVDLPNGSLNVASTTTGGISFASDPGGGSGDIATIKYYVVSGEKTVLELKVANDAAGASQDSINFVSSGGVGVNTQSPSEALHVTGNILASGDITAFSDIKLKTNVQPIENALSIVQKLEGVTYTRIDNNEDSMGVIANKIQEHLPMLVKTANDGTLSVNYNGFSGLFIECFKDLINEINILKREIKTLKGE